MSAVTFKFKALPKRMAKKSEAAGYCGLPVKRFEADFPFKPVRMPGGDALIDLQDCDRWIESLRQASPIATPTRSLKSSENDRRQGEGISDIQGPAWPVALLSSEDRTAR